MRSTAIHKQKFDSQYVIGGNAIQISDWCCFSIPFHSTRIVPLHFQAGYRGRRLNLALVLCVDFVLHVFFG